MTDAEVQLAVLDHLKCSRAILRLQIDAALLPDWFPALNQFRANAARLVSARERVEMNRETTEMVRSALVSTVHIVSHRFPQTWQDWFYAGEVSGDETLELLRPEPPKPTEGDEAHVPV